jgi:uncharacterized RDD family membrane protein YckC
MEIKFTKERIFALLIDQFIINSSYSILNKFFNFDFAANKFLLFGMKWTLNVSFVFIASLIYFFFFDFLKNGTTIGKSILKIKIQKINGDELSFSERFITSLLKVISITLLPLSAIYYFFTKTVFHDRIMKIKTIKLL